MYTLCTTEKTALQQLQFEKAFLELSLELPYDDITVSELCRRAGLSRKIFYRLFERKADVLYALLDHTVLDFQTYQPDSSIAPGNLHRFLAFWQDQKLLLDVLKKNGSSHMLTDAVIRHMLRDGSEFNHTLGLNEDPFSREALIFYVSGIFALVLNWHDQGYAQSIDELSAALMYLLATPPVKHPMVSSAQGLDRFR